MDITSRVIGVAALGFATAAILAGCAVEAGDTNDESSPAEEVIEQTEDALLLSHAYTIYFLGEPSISNCRNTIRSYCMSEHPGSPSYSVTNASVEHWYAYYFVCGGKCTWYTN